MKVVTGYPGGNEVGLAMERGEVQGRCGWSWSSVKSTHQKSLDDKKFSILVQLALDKHPELPDVPLIIDLAKTEEQRQILRLIFARQAMGRPFVGPPNIPPDRAKMLRDAFMATMQDKDFLADTAKAQMEITPVDGEKVQALVKELYATPPEIAQKATALLR
jgi:tripartite-type tricarboxylate transporter receptor subunit TctC